MSAPLLIGERLRKLRKEKKLSQGDIEKRTGLLRAHISILTVAEPWLKITEIHRR
jgi:transcriptional regulator with XRE-family HTH domain